MWAPLRNVAMASRWPPFAATTNVKNTRAALVISRRTLSVKPTPMKGAGRTITVKRVLGTTAVAAPIVFWAYYVTRTEKERRMLDIHVGSIGRFVRSAYYGILIASDYKKSLRGMKEDDPEYERVSSQIHRRSAERLRDGCLLNGGLYVKLGQGLAALNHLLPREWIEVMSYLNDRALPRSPGEVDRLFREEFDAAPEEVFLEFEREPVAAASLAQVHRATLKSGERVAVKLQYIDLRDRYDGDLWTIEFLLNAIQFLFPSFGFRWVLKELKETLQEELDFEIEARNGERCAEEMKDLPFAKVPTIHWEWTRKRVLTAEWVDGVKIDDLAGLRGLGLDLADVDEKLIKISSRQLFRTGFVHADPHPGNVHVKKGRDGKAEIILLDHGLYQQFSDSHREALCRLWKSIILRNECDMREHALQLGVRNWFLFCEILLQRPLKRESFALPVAMSKEDVAYMQKMASDHFDGIMQALKSMPSSMLLIFRNLNTIRAILREHGNPCDRYTMMAREAMDSVAIVDQKNSKPIIGRLTSTIEKLRFEYVLGKERFIIWLTSAYFKLLHYLGRVEEYETVKDILSQQE